MMKRIAVALVLLLAFCGIANSAYLTKSEKTATPLLCDVSGLTDCNTVAQSPYSYIYGISLAEYGLIFYGLLFFLAAVELFLADRILRRMLQVLAFFGFFASIYFVFIQVVVINALCIYCTASAVLALLIFLCAGFIEPLRKNGVVTSVQKPIIPLPASHWRDFSKSASSTPPAKPEPPKPPRHLPMPPSA